MKIYMIRHGQTDWNKSRRMQGKVDIQLNQSGRESAVVTGNALKEISFDLVYSSPLQRAMETARLVIGDRDVPIFTDDRIEEIGFGVLEGSYITEESKETQLKDFYENPAGYIPPDGGESIYELKQRTDHFLDELNAFNECQDKTILITTHGAALCSLLNYFDANPVERFWRSGVPGNCSVSIVEKQGGRFVIISENQIYTTSMKETSR